MRSAVIKTSLCDVKNDSITHIFLINKKTFEDTRNLKKSDFISRLKNSDSFNKLPQRLFKINTLEPLDLSKEELIQTIVNDINFDTYTEIFTLDNNLYGIQNSKGLKGLLPRELVYFVYF